MSLLTTITLRVLYAHSCQVDGLEHKTVSFWAHLLGKIYFKEEYFVIDHQIPPSASDSDRLRRVDFSIAKADLRTNELAVIAFIEGKKTKASEENLETVEAQCYNACESHMRHRPSCKEIWAIGVVGPTAQVWHHKRGEDFRTMTNGTYLDANGPHAGLLHTLFTTMAKQYEPKTLASTPAYTQQQQTQVPYSAATLTPYQYALRPNTQSSAASTVPEGMYRVSDGKLYVRDGWYKGANGNFYSYEASGYYKASDGKWYLPTSSSK